VLGYGKLVTHVMYIPFQQLSLQTGKAELNLTNHLFLQIPEAPPTLQQQWRRGAGNRNDAMKLIEHKEITKMASHSPPNEYTLKIHIHGLIDPSCS
jgi:hypothetical protein